MAPAQPQETLELDELWSFVGHRRRGVVWLWLALCRRTRQIVAYAPGPRDDATARLLWERIPLANLHDPLCTDLYKIELLQQHFYLRHNFQWDRYHDRYGRSQQSKLQGRWKDSICRMPDRRQP